MNVFSSLVSVGRSGDEWKIPPGSAGFLRAVHLHVTGSAPVGKETPRQARRARHKANRAAKRAEMAGPWGVIETIELDNPAARLDGYGPWLADKYGGK